MRLLGKIAVVVGFPSAVDKFLRERHGPEFEFVDTALESDRLAMIDRLSRLDRLIGTVARPVPDQSGWYRIPIEWLDPSPRIIIKWLKV